jgi:RNA polymerase sigma factor (sigma-70 family)
LNANRELRSLFDSADFTQSVWKSFFSTFDAERFQSKEQLTAFLAGKARDEVHAEARKRLTPKYDLRREQALDDSADDQRLADGGGQPLPIDLAIAGERLEEILHGQPEQHREIIRLRRAGRSCAAIAAELQLDETTVHRFLAKLLRDAANK